MAALELTLTNGKTWIDAEDYDLVSPYRWCIGSSGKGKRYVMASEVTSPGKHRTIRIHRLIMGATPGQVVDHIDGDPLNNRRSNLRICSHVHNCQNRHAVWAKTGYKGVILRTRVRQPSRYVARIRVNGRLYQIGSYLTSEEAARAYDKEAKEVFGAFSKTNF